MTIEAIEQNIDIFVLNISPFNLILFFRLQLFLVKNTDSSVFHSFRLCDKYLIKNPIRDCNAIVEIHF